MSTLVPPSPDLSPGSPLWNLVTVAHATGMVGVFLTVLLCGLALAQAYSYFNQYPQDSIWMKQTVWLVTLLNLAHAITVFINEYHYLIEARANVLDQLLLYWAIPGSVALHLAISGTVLCYFTRMCYELLSGKKILQKLSIVVLGVPILGHLGFGTAAVIRGSGMKTLQGIYILGPTTLIPMVSLQVVADVLISLALCLALPRPSTVLKQTRNAIQVIMLYAITRGIITSVAAVLEVIAFVATPTPHNLWFMAVEYVIAGLYTNSFLSTLNSRQLIRKRLAGKSGIKTSQPVSIPLGFYRPNNSSDPTTDTDCNDLSRVPTSNEQGSHVDVYGGQKHDNAVTGDAIV